MCWTWGYWVWAMAPLCHSVYYIPIFVSPKSNLNKILGTLCHNLVVSDNLRGMLIEMEVFGAVGIDPATWKDALNLAFDDFTQWRKTEKIASSQKRFTYRMVTRDDYGYYLNAKGYNARVVSEWLLAKVVEVKSNPGHLVLDHEQMDLCEATLTLEFKATTFFTLWENTKNIVVLDHPLPTSINPSTPPRSGINRYFGLTERASRCLLHGRSAIARCSTEKVEHGENIMRIIWVSLGFFGDKRNYKKIILRPMNF